MTKNFGVTPFSENKPPYSNVGKLNRGQPIWNSKLTINAANMPRGNKNKRIAVASSRTLIFDRYLMIT